MVLSGTTVNEPTLEQVVPLKKAEEPRLQLDDYPVRLAGMGRSGQRHCIAMQELPPEQQFKRMTSNLVGEKMNILEELDSLRTVILVSCFYGLTFHHPAWKEESGLVTRTPPMSSCRPFCGRVLLPCGPGRRRGRGRHSDLLQFPHARPVVSVSAWLATMRTVGLDWLKMFGITRSDVVYCVTIVNQASCLYPEVSCYHPANGRSSCR